MKASFREILRLVKSGAMLIVVDNQGRENEGDIFMAAEKVQAKHVNFIIKNCRGLLCTPITAELAYQLNLRQMVEKNQDRYKTKFTVSIDHISTTTGISASERAKSIQSLSRKDVKADDFTRPGHIFPIVSAKNILYRTGHTEAAIEMLRLAGMREVGLICEIIADNGEMARGNDLKAFAKKHELAIIHIDDIITEALKERKLLTSLWNFSIAAEWGDLDIAVYPSTDAPWMHVLIHWNFSSGSEKHVFSPIFCPESPNNNAKKQGNTDTAKKDSRSDLLKNLKAFQSKENLQNAKHAFAIFPFQAGALKKLDEPIHDADESNAFTNSLSALKYIFENTIETSLLREKKLSLDYTNEAALDFIASLQRIQALKFLEADTFVRDKLQWNHKDLFFGDGLFVHIKAFIQLYMRREKADYEIKEDSFQVYACDTKAIDSFGRVGLTAKSNRSASSMSTFAQPLSM